MEQFISQKSFGNFVLAANNKICCIIDKKFPCIFEQIFVHNSYEIRSSTFDTQKKYVVLDLGANRGYSALFFASKDYIERVYCFELIPQTASFAKINFLLNTMKIRNKIQLYEFGLAANDMEITAFHYEKNDSISNINYNFNTDYIHDNSYIKVKTLVVQASRFLRRILFEHENVILKIDVEGAEHEIFEDLFENYPEIFNKIQLILGEIHANPEPIFAKLKILGYESSYLKNIDNYLYEFEMTRSK